MPIYEYICQSCGHEFEQLVRGQQRPCCPSCGKGRLTKKFSVPAAHTGESAGESGTCDTGACRLPGCEPGGSCSL